MIENREEKFGTLRKGGENVGNCTFRMQISNDPRDDLPFFSAEIERADGLRRPPPRNDNIYVYIYIYKISWSSQVVPDIDLLPFSFFSSSSLSLFISYQEISVESPVVFMTRTSSPSFARDLENIGYERASGYINSVARLNAVYVNIYVHAHTYIQYIHI